MTRNSEIPTNPNNNKEDTKDILSLMKYPEGSNLNSIVCFPAGMIIPLNT